MNAKKKSDIENATVTYNRNGVHKTLSAQKVGQLAVTRAMWLDGRTWRFTISECFDILHIMSSLRIDTVECSYFEALKIAESLSLFDFDLFYENFKKGVRDEEFVQAVRFELARQTMPYD